MIDRLLWRLWVSRRWTPIQWHIPQRVWSWWTDRLAQSADTAGKKYRGGEHK